MVKYLVSCYKLISRNEFKFLYIFIFFILFLTLVPGFFATIISGDSFFTGRTFIAGGDKMVYLSQIEEARQGNIITHNLYTSEPQQGYFSPLWLTMGWFSRITFISPLITFHLFRIIFGFFFLYLLYLFISRIFSSVIFRKITFLVLALSSGFGIFTVIRPWTAQNMYDYFGSDTWMSEGNTFLTLYHSPLFIISQLLLLIIFWWILERINLAKYKEILIIGLLGFVLGFLHPYDIVIVYSVLLVWFLIKVITEKHWSWQIFFKLLVIFLISSISIIYYLFLKYFDPVFAGWAVQNVTLSPSIFNYIMGYGLIFILFLIGLYYIRKSKNKYLIFLLIWAVVSWFLLFSPLPVQRRLSNGMHIPMVIIGMWGIKILWDKYQFSKFVKIIKKTYIASFLIIIFSALLTLTNIFNLGIEFFDNIYYKDFYFTNNEYQAVIWLKTNVQDKEIILSENKFGNYIPAFTGRYVYLGHGHQTNNWFIKKSEVEEWFLKSNNIDDKKYQWLIKEGIDYVYYGQYEKKLGDFKPDDKKYLESVYKNDEVEIFKVIPLR